MSFTVVPQGGNNIGSAIAITAFSNSPETIAGTALGTNSTRGDAILVAGSTSNDDTYIVLDVVDADTVEVYPAVTSEAAAGTAQIKRNDHKLEIVDEGSIGPTDIETAMASVDSRLFRKLIRTAGADNQMDVWMFLFRHFEFHRTATGTTTYVSTNDVYLLDYDGDKRNLAAYSYFEDRGVSGGLGEIILQFGSLGVSSDRRSAKDGCVLLNTVPTALVGASDARRICTQVGGSAIFTESGGVASFEDGPSTEGYFSNCLAYGGIFAPTSGRELSEINNIIYRGRNSGLPIVGVPASSSNLLLVDNVSSGILANNTEETLVEEMEISEDFTTPVVLLFSSACKFLNPREDYTSAQLFNAFSAGSGIKSYTFNPQFIDYSPLTGPSPISGASVTIEKFVDARIVNVANNHDGTYTITINGEDHTYEASGNTAASIKVQLASAINAGSQPVTATVETSPPQFGDAIFIKSDVDYTIFDIEVSSPSSDLVLDPAATAGGASHATDDTVPGVVTGSPFTTDANGRINSGNGFDMSSFVVYSFLGTCNMFYRVFFEKPGYERLDMTLVLEAKAVGVIPVAPARMGGVR